MNDDAGYNILELRRPKAIKAELVGGHLRLHLPQKVNGERGFMTGFGPPPRTIETDRLLPATERLSASERLFLTTDDSYIAAARVFLALDRWGQVVASAAANSKISGDGRHDLIVEATIAQLTAIGKQFAVLEQIRVDLSQQHVALYAPTEREASKADGDVDIYLYGQFASMSLSEQIATVMGGKPEYARLLLALARSPLPLSKEISEHFDEAWAATVARQKPAEAATLALAEAANAWAAGITRYLAGLLANPSTSGTTGAFDELAQYQALRAVDAVGLLEFPAWKVVSFEQRIASIAA